MTWTPQFRIYASNGSTLVYTLPNVIDTNWPIENPGSIEISNIRGSGSIIIPEGSKSYDLIFRGLLTAVDYTALTTAIFSLKDTILTNVPYVLKCDKSNITTDNINVTRIDKITFGETNRNTYVYYTLTLKANSW